MWVLCLLFAGGSIDTLPDPPAVKPQSVQKNLIPQRLDDHAGVTAENDALESVARGGDFQAGVFLFVRNFEGEISSYDPTFVRQSTDSSPPCFK